MLVRHYLPSKHLFQLINRSTGKMSEICSKLKIKTPERHHWRRSNVFIVNFEYFTPFCSVSIVEFRVWLCICLLGIDFGAIQNICYEQNGIFYPPMSRPVILFSNSLLLCFRGKNEQRKISSDWHHFFYGTVTSLYRFLLLFSWTLVPTSWMMYFLNDPLFKQT